MKTPPRRTRRPDPFAWCRKRDILVERIGRHRRWMTGHFMGDVFVYINPTLSRAEQRRALEEALLAHPTLVVVVSPT